MHFPASRQLTAPKDGPCTANPNSAVPQYTDSGPWNFPLGQGDEGPLRGVGTTWKSPEASRLLVPSRLPGTQYSSTRGLNCDLKWFLPPR